MHASAIASTRCTVCRNSGELSARAHQQSLKFHQYTGGHALNDALYLLQTKASAMPRTKWEATEARGEQVPPSKWSRSSTSSAERHASERKSGSADCPVPVRHALAAACINVARFLACLFDLAVHQRTYSDVCRFIQQQHAKQRHKNIQVRTCDGPTTSARVLGIAPDAVCRCSTPAGPGIGAACMCNMRTTSCFHLNGA